LAVRDALRRGCRVWFRLVERGFCLVECGLGLVECGFGLVGRGLGRQEFTVYGLCVFECRYRA
jgi:hypothetical protein